MAAVAEGRQEQVPALKRGLRRPDGQDGPTSSLVTKASDVMQGGQPDRTEFAGIGENRLENRSTVGPGSQKAKQVAARGSRQCPIERQPANFIRAQPLRASEGCLPAAWRALSKQGDHLAWHACGRAARTGS